MVYYTLYCKIRNTPIWGLDKEESKGKGWKAWGRLYLNSGLLECPAVINLASECFAISLPMDWRLSGKYLYKPTQSFVYHQLIALGRNEFARSTFDEILFKKIPTFPESRMGKLMFAVAGCCRFDAMRCH